MSGLLVTFSRQSDRPFLDSVAALGRWSPPRFRWLRVRSVTVEAPGDLPTVYRLGLRFGGPGRSTPVEVRITPWSDAGSTHIELVPGRRVRPTAGYFQRCRIVLNEVVAALAFEDGGHRSIECTLDRSA